MSIKNKTVRIVIYAVLGAIALYTGISCAATLQKALTQPYLLSAAERFDFTGYYILSAANGVPCVASALFIILTAIKSKT